MADKEKKIFMIHLLFAKAKSCSCSSGSGTGIFLLFLLPLRRGPLSFPSLLLLLRMPVMKSWGSSRTLIASKQKTKQNKRPKAQNKVMKIRKD